MLTRDRSCARTPSSVFEGGDFTPTSPAIGDSAAVQMIPTSTSSLQVNRTVLSFTMKFALQPSSAPEPLLFHIVSRPLHLNSFLFISFPEAVRGRGASPVNRHSKCFRKNTRGTVTKHGISFPLKSTLALLTSCPHCAIPAVCHPESPRFLRVRDLLFGFRPSRRLGFQQSHQHLRETPGRGSPVARLFSSVAYFSLVAILLFRLRRTLSRDLS